MKLFLDVDEGIKSFLSQHKFELLSELLKKP